MRATFSAELSSVDAEQFDAAVDYFDAEENFSAAENLSAE
jgi:hypothetical protein